MNTGRIDEKYEHLKDILKTFGNVAVAFSGGVDSTFLLYAACETLGENKVVALHGASCLLPDHISRAAQKIFERHISQKAKLRVIELHPLQWDEVVVNDENRCYFCKKRIYSLFKTDLGEEGGCRLIDGTNTDDLKERRPGLRAIKELGVLTPLVMAGLHKSEIRDLARSIGLENHDLPSNSCLATRVMTNTPLHAGIIKMIDNAERFLHDKGFEGCRVRPGADWTVVEVRSEDLERLTWKENRESILLYFQTMGLSQVFFDLHGRK